LAHESFTSLFFKMKLYSSVPDDIAAWAQRQPVFYTGSAPTHLPHINVSPKGLAATHFCILTPNLCAYIDRTGSGCETIAHAYDNGRLCIMFNSFGPTPGILRFFCRSRVVEWDEPEFGSWVKRITGSEQAPFDGARAVIVGEIWEVQTSCGYGVPRVKKALYAPTTDEGDALPLDSSVEAVLRQGFKADKSDGDTLDAKLTELSVFEERPAMDQWAAQKTSNNSLIRYQRDNNSCSIDGLPGLRAARRDAGEKGKLWLGDAKARLTRATAERHGAALGFMIALVLWVILTKLAVL
jgi:hypothetical protein